MPKAFARFVQLREDIPDMVEFIKGELDAVAGFLEIPVLGQSLIIVAEKRSVPYSEREGLRARKNIQKKIVANLSEMKSHLRGSRKRFRKLSERIISGLPEIRASERRALERMGQGYDVLVDKHVNIMKGNCKRVLAAEMKNAWSLFTWNDFLVNVFSKISGGIHSELEPLRKFEGLLKVFLVRVQEMEDDIADIGTEINDELTWRFDLDSALTIRGFTADYIVIDADFLKALHLQKEAEDRRLRCHRPRYVLNFPHGRLIVTERVWTDITTRSSGHMLVPPALSDHVKDLAGTLTAVNINPNSKEVDAVVQQWMDCTPKGKRARMHRNVTGKMSKDERDFRNKGDLDILVFATRRKNEKILIYSNDTDVGEYVGESHSNNKMTGVVVCSNRSGSLSIVAKWGW